MTADKTTSIAVSGPSRDPKAMKKLSAGDFLVEATHLGIQSIPLLGPGASAMLKLAIQSPIQRRSEEFIGLVHEDLRSVEDRLSCIPDELYQAGAYSSALISTTHIALLTREPEKMDALRAAMLNIALTGSDDEAFNQMRIAALRDMTSIHIKTLDFFARRNARDVEKLGKDNRAITPADFKDPLKSLFRHDLPFYILERACRELESAGLIGVRSGYTKSLGGDNFATMLATDFGLVLNKFMTLPYESRPTDAEGIEGSAGT